MSEYFEDKPIIMYGYSIEWNNNSHIPSRMSLPTMFRSPHAWYGSCDVVITDENGRLESVPYRTTSLPASYENLEKIINSKIRYLKGLINRQATTISYNYDCNKKMLKEAEKFLIDIQKHRLENVEEFPEKFI